MHLEMDLGWKRQQRKLPRLQARYSCGTERTGSLRRTNDMEEAMRATAGTSAQFHGESLDWYTRAVEAQA